MKAYEILVSFQAYRVGDIVTVKSDDPNLWAWGNLVNAGYAVEHPADPSIAETIKQIEGFLNDLSTGVKRERPKRKVKEAEGGEDPAEPDPGAADSEG